MQQRLRAINRQRTQLRQHMDHLESVNELPQVQDPFVPPPSPIVPDDMSILPVETSPFEPDGDADDAVLPQS